MGIGVVGGDEWVKEVIKWVIFLLLLEVFIDGVEYVLVNVMGGKDLFMIEVEDVFSVIC